MMVEDALVGVTLGLLDVLLEDELFDEFEVPEMDVLPDVVCDGVN